MNYVFGPVISRRLGRSLGVDVVPFKYCTQDCIYCQLGKTTHKTVRRDIYLPVEKVLEELKEKLNTNPNFITIAGSGEPLLCHNIGEIIENIKTLTDIPVAVLTNGSLLYIQEVRANLLSADVVCPSLDAGCEATFKKINNPDENIDFRKFVEGLIEFRKEFKGKIWLEIMLVKGVNDSVEEVERIAKYASAISPDKIHLNTVTRPPAEKSIEGLSAEVMEGLCNFFIPKAEVIAEIKPEKTVDKEVKSNFIDKEDIDNRILEILKRHPSSPIELSEILATPQQTILDRLLYLENNETIVKAVVQGKEIYRLRNPLDN